MKGLIVTYVLTYGGALVSLFNPFTGLLVYICFAIIKPEALWYWSVPEGNYSRTVALALLVGWLLNGTGDWQLGRSRLVLYSLLGYMFWCMVSTASSADPSLGYKFVEELAKVVVPFVAGITLIDSPAKLRQLGWVILLSLGYLAFDLNVSYYEGFNRIVLQGFAGMDNNSFAIAMVAGSGLGFFLGLGEQNFFLKGLAFTLTGLQAHVILFSDSRGGMMGLLVTGLVIFLLIPKTPKHYFAAIVAILIIYRLAGPQTQARFMSSFAGKDERDPPPQVASSSGGRAGTACSSAPSWGSGPTTGR
jgi:hypothetical protein